MVADMPKYVIGNTPNSKMVGYGDDSTAYVHSKDVCSLKHNLENISNRMITYCHNAGLVLNNDKTQLLVSPKQACQIKVGSSLISSSQEINLLRVEFDSNFTTLPFLHKLSQSANTRVALISRLSYFMPPHLMSMFSNGLLMGKILSACPATIPIRLSNEDKSFISVTKEINKAIKAIAHTITKTKLSDKFCSEEVLKRANLKCLNEAVASWHFQYENP